MDVEKYFGIYFLILKGLDNTDRLSVRKSYEEMEQIHVENYGYKKYPNYGAFRAAKSRFVQRRMSKAK